MKYGRKDAVKPEDCVDEGNLPAGNKPFPDADNAQVSQSVFPFILLHSFMCIFYKRQRYIHVLSLLYTHCPPPSALPTLLYF